MKLFLFCSIALLVLYVSMVFGIFTTKYEVQMDKARSLQSLSMEYAKAQMQMVGMPDSMFTDNFNRYRHYDSLSRVEFWKAKLIKDEGNRWLPILKPF